MAPCDAARRLTDGGVLSDVFLLPFVLAPPPSLSRCPLAQKNPSDAANYFSRRMAMMKEQLDKAYGVLNQKRQLFEAVSHLLQNKLEAAQAAQAQAGAQPSG